MGRDAASEPAPVIDPSRFRLVTYAVPYVEGEGPIEWRWRVASGEADVVADEMEG